MLIKKEELYTQLSDLAIKAAEAAWAEDGPRWSLVHVQTIIARKPVHHLIVDNTDTLDDEGRAELHFLKVYFDRLSELAAEAV
jgi:hypothetical protein